jgi:hypothetical protein
LQGKSDGKFTRSILGENQVKKQGTLLPRGADGARLQFVEQA